MKLKMLLTLIITVVFSSFLTYAETVEEQLLKQKQAKIKTYYFEARNGGKAQKLDVLNNLIGEFDTAKYSSKDKEIVDIVIYLSQEGTLRKEYEANMLANDYPEVRQKAAIVLARLGGDDARDALISLLASEKNQMVKAEICNSLAEIKDNDKGEALMSVVFIYRSTYRPEPNLAFAVINAIKNIAKENTSYYGDAISVLSDIQMGNYNRVVREAAYNAIREMSGATAKK
jgi:hypothetical protein